MRFLQKKFWHENEKSLECSQFAFYDPNVGKANTENHSFIKLTPKVINSQKIESRTVVTNINKLCLNFANKSRHKTPYENVA